MKPLFITRTFDLSNHALQILIALQKFQKQPRTSKSPPEKFRPTPELLICSEIKPRRPNQRNLQEIEMEELRRQVQQLQETVNAQQALLEQ